jgi:hypothetical protein
MDDRLDTGSFIIRSLVQDVLLSSSESTENNVRITCVELWGTIVALFRR